MMSKNLHKVNNARARIVNADHEMVGVVRLSTHPGNPRRGDLAAVKASIEVNGFYGTIVAQRSTGYVLAGNHRLMAARELGMEHVPVVWVDCDDTRARAILAADNRTSELGGFDSEALAQLLEGLRIEDALAGTGYSDDDISALIEASNIPGDEDWGGAFDAVPDGDREPIQAMTFQLHDDQADVVRAALGMAGTVDHHFNTNTNGNALWAICKAYLNG
jgi:hypothetical protein